MKTKVLIYNSLVVSHLIFCIHAWGYQCDRVIKLLKKVIRILNLRKYNAHTDPIFKELKLLKVKDILKLQELKFFFKYKNWKLPYYLKSLPFSPNSDIHDNETRIQHNIHELKSRNDYAKQCIRFDLPKVINNTPRQMLDKIHTHSLQGFSGYIKQHILNSY